MVLLTEGLGASLKGSCLGGTAESIWLQKPNMNAPLVSQLPSVFWQTPEFDMKSGWVWVWACSSQSFSPSCLYLNHCHCQLGHSWRTCGAFLLSEKKKPQYSPKCSDWQPRSSPCRTLLKIGDKPLFHSFCLAACQSASLPSSLWLCFSSFLVWVQVLRVIHPQLCPFSPPIICYHQDHFSGDYQGENWPFTLCDPTSHWKLVLLPQRIESSS